ncbi:hypothetical protein F383_27632 [Gossypium arboreum]|uniref:Uncharacterized protein n=1 Tax=Gossypium arboreum TaxID=29729 RepID=A0A0B0PDC3_GOSAR|nr:hypothetical protein F383_27632 [Gossypium arboreum]
MYQEQPLLGFGQASKCCQVSLGLEIVGGSITLSSQLLESMNTYARIIK